jgi:hypothetical protein
MRQMETMGSQMDRKTATDMEVEMIGHPAR